MKEILNQLLELDIKKIKYDKNLILPNTSEYEFELVKSKITLEDNEEIEMYLKMIKNNRIKESIFCYWCSIYEEEMLKSNNKESAINKVLITELDKTKYKKSLFLTIENNKAHILESGSEVNFIEINKYIEEEKNKQNELEKLEKYFDKEDDYVLMIGIKMNAKMEKI